MSYTPCPVCGGGLPGTRPCSCFQQPAIWHIPQEPKGCICPPTSEQTCQAADCPRKGVSTAARTSGSDSVHLETPDD